MHLWIKPTVKKSLYTLVSVIFFYWIFLRKKRYTETFNVTLEAVEPKTAWEYMADFSNQAKFNPTIYDFEVDYEKGNYALWEYGVTYKESLVLFPFIRHVNTAVYRVTPESHHGHHDPFRIDSQHTCCIFFMCLRTDAQMTFKSGKAAQTTELEEIIQFECPPLMSTMCRRELRAQRGLIRQRLEELDMNM